MKIQPEFNLANFDFISFTSTVDGIEYTYLCYAQQNTKQTDAKWAIKRTYTAGGKTFHRWATANATNVGIRNGPEMQFTIEDATNVSLYQEQN